MKYNGILSLLALVIVGCCPFGPQYSPPCVEAPEEWTTPVAPEIPNEPVECFHWWEAYHDPALNFLIETASQQNLDVKIASAKILEARTYVEGKKGDYLPHIDGTLNYAHLGYNQRVVNEILGTHCENNHRRRNLNIFEAGFDAEWELDLFGFHRYEKEALQANAEAAREEMKSLMVSLTAEITRNYITLRAAQLRLKILQKNIQSQLETVHLTQGLVKTGFASNTDQWEGEGQLHLLQSEEPALEAEISRIIQKLVILTGCQPEGLICLLSEPQPLPQLPSEMPLCAPCEVLRSRPDIIAAERNLAAASARIGVATAALFPRLSLIGFLGDVSAHAGKPGYVWYAGPQILAPLFNSRAIQEDITINKIKSQQAFYEYQKTVFAAIEETENALTAYQKELHRRHNLEQAYLLAQRSYEETYELYQRGFKGYLEVLLASKVKLGAEEKLIDSSTQLLIQFAAVYKAFGGGWDISE